MDLLNGEQIDTLTLDVQRTHQAGPWSGRLAEVCLRFGICPEPEQVVLAKQFSMPLGRGTVAMIVGPSGAGKTSLLETLGRHNADSRHVNRVRFPAKPAIVDAVACRQSLREALSILTACGLGEPRLWIRRFDELSDGERFRARLARAISLHLQRRDPSPPLLCDEFGSILHRRAAKAIACNLAKLARRRGITFVVALAQEDLIADLQPDTLVRFRGQGLCEVTTATPKESRPSFARRFHIESGRKADYDFFAPMHYRHRDELGFVDKVFVLRDGVGGDPLGIVVYAHGPLELNLRNVATNGRFRRNPKRLNRELRILRRLVIHPDIRGCGVGHWLMRKTLPMAGVPYVECLAAMGQVNPVFEKAGMQRIGICAPPPGRKRLLSWLRRQGADPLDRDFEEKVARRRKIRAVVADVVRDWYQATTGAKRDRVAGQTPKLLAQTFRQLAGSEPVYYVWNRDGDRFDTPGPGSGDRGTTQTGTGTGLSVCRQESKP